MTGDSKDFSLPYVAALKDVNNQKRGKCPEPLQLMKLARGLIRPGKKERIIRHLEICPDCAREYSAMYKIVREEKHLISESAKIRNRTASAGREGRKGWVSHPVFLLRPGLAVALVVCLAVAAGTLFITRSLRTTGDLRSGNVNQVKIISPIQETLVPGNIVFKWEKLETADYYIVEFFDTEMNLVWESPRIDSSNLALPGDEVNKIRSEGRYFWMVTAHFSGGDKVESDLNEFSVKQ